MQLTKRNIIKIAILLAIILFIITLFIKYYSDNKKIKQSEKEETIEIVKDNNTEEKEEIVKVSADIKGAIKNPGVYDIEKDKKVIDLVKLAGGLTDEADTTYINLARKVTDEMVVIIYTKDQIKKAKEKETTSIENVTNTCICPKIVNDACITKETTKSTSETKTNNDSASNSNNTNEKININTASLEELQTLSGVGASKAQSIIDYRNEFGKFSKIEDILNVSGIGESVYEKIKDSITI